MNRTELYIKIRDVWKELELTDDVSIPITFSISDVTDPSKVKSSFSKSISIPDTAHNRDLLEGLYDVNNITTSNINDRMDCVIYRDTLITFEGKIRFDNISTSNNKKFVYQATLLGENNNLFKSIGEKFMTDLDLSPLNHTFSVSNIMNTWTSSTAPGYYYGLIDYTADFDIVGSNETRLYRPQVYLKKFVDDILSDAGYVYQSDFFDNDATYNNTLIPYMDVKDSKITSIVDNKNERVFIGLTTSNQVYGFTLSAGVSNNSENTQRLRFANETIPYSDIQSKWNSSLYQYNGDGVNRTIQFGLNLDFTLDIQGLATVFDDYILEVEFRRSKNPKTGAVNTTTGFAIPTLKPIQGGGITDPYIIKRSIDTNFYGSVLSNFTSNNVVNTSLPFETYRGVVESALLDGRANVDNLFNPIEVGEFVWATIRLKWFRTSTTTTGNFNYITFNSTPTVGDFGSFFISNLNAPSNFSNGFTVNMNALLPQNIKQKDFLSSVIKMFNLYIDVDKLNSKKLIIEPRNTFYKSMALDFSDKLDISSEIKQELLIDKNSQYLFTHKNDVNELLLKNYFDEFNEVYGQEKIELEGEYKSSSTKIETIFTPLVTQNVDLLGGFQYKSLIVGRMSKINPKTSDFGKFSGGLRICQRNPAGFVLLDNTERYLFATFSLNYYPYVGHYNHPLNASSDLNFGLTKALYYDGNVATSNNLYNLYWRELVEEMTDIDARIVTATFYLDPNDINQFSFRNLIRVNQISPSSDVIFKVNKLDYDPNSKKATLELLKSKQFDYRSVGGIGRTSSFTSLTPPKTDFSDGVGIISVGNNTNDGTGTGILIGRANQFGANFGSLIMSGDNNSIGSSARMSNIIGSSGSNIDGQVYGSNIIGGINNRIGLDSNDTFIFGGLNNAMSSGVTNSFIFGGGNLTLTQSNVAYFPNKVIVGSLFDLNGNSINSYEEVTLTNLNTTLIPGNLLTPGTLYKINTAGTTYKDNGIFLQAISTNQLSKSGVRLFLAPGTYDTTTDGFGNVWLGIWNSSLTPSAGNLCIWGGRVWSNVSGSVGASVDDFTLNAQWTSVGRNTFSNGQYIEMIMNCEFDYANNWVEKQSDRNNNIVGVSLDFYNFYSLTMPNPSDVTDWNILTDVNVYTFYDNNVNLGIFNNTYLSNSKINSNKVDSWLKNNFVYEEIINNITSNLSDNIGSGGSIIGNVIITQDSTSQIGSGISNNNSTSITYNIGGKITGNTSSTISNNKTIVIRGNSASGISDNQSKTIESNNIGGVIQFNFNLGFIEQNTNTGNINNNSNSGNIDNNSNAISNIRYNINNGSISNNTGTGGPWLIEYNINNGTISGARTANVTDTVVNK